jgi:ActR/RegA family two-component response regulator
MLAEVFAEAHPVADVLLMVAVVLLVGAVVVFLRPIERYLNKNRGKAPPPAAGVLWIDDRPEHNARLLNGLRSRAVPVDVVQTTGEALTCLVERAYAIVVLDLSRVEEVADADLRQVEDASGTTPVVVFSRYRTLVDSEVTVVSSEAEIMEWLREVNLL